MEESERFMLQLVSEEKASATEDRKRLDCLYRCGLVGGRVCILGDKSKIDARKEDRGSRKKKEGQFYRDRMRGQLRDTIDGGAEIRPG